MKLYLRDTSRLPCYTYRRPQQLALKDNQPGEDALMNFVL